MNQILMTENKKVDRNSKIKKQNNNYSEYNGAGSRSTNGSAKIFAIAILIFGIFLSGSGVYAFSKNAEEQRNKSISVVSYERTGNSLKLSIKNDTGIKNIQYAWNDSNYTVVAGGNKTKLETTINIISGQNKLNIIVTDIKGLTTQYVKNYEQEGEDVTEPKIEISNEDPKIKITVTDDTKLDYIAYKYGDNEEVTVKASEENPTKIETYIEEVQEDLVKLKVEAVDAAKNHATFEQQVKGTTKPDIEISYDPADFSNLIIKATDKDGIRMVVWYINDEEYKTDPNVPLNTKEFEKTVKVEPGETHIKVHAYNLSEQVSEYDVIYKY